MTEAFSTFRTDRIEASGLRELGALMRGFSRRIGADAYLLFEHRPQTGSVGLIACDWPFDMIAEIGSSGLDRLARAGIACVPGDAASIVALDADTIPQDLSLAARENGYESLICQSLPVGDALFVAVYCAGAGALDADEAELAQMRAIYAISQRLKAKAEIASPLSVREKECLGWVAEGKTTEEVAMILGVSANTINAYIAKAIQKVAATNRAMAIATAIRAGMI